MKFRTLHAIAGFGIAALLSACGTGIAGGSLRGDVAAAINALNTSGPYRMRIETLPVASAEIDPSALEFNEKQVVDVVPPVDMHMRSDSPNQDEMLEIIRIGTKAWIRQEGKFVESTVSADSQEAFTAAPFVGTEFVKNTSNHAVLPEQTIGTVKARGYSFTYTDIDGSTSAYQIWVNAEKNTPIKIEVAYPEIKQVYTFEYDGSIKVLPPAK